jgi:D-tyrosyl-tRNA(Tyr) deacylase
MIALLQRVTRAEVSVAGARCGAIGTGLLALIGVRPDDDSATMARLLERILAQRLFSDQDDRMNRCLAEVGGGLLLVPQFTLAADTRKGNRPGFSSAAEPTLARRLFEELVALAAATHSPVACGQFGADMQVSLVNDGPVTVWLES